MSPMEDGARYPDISLSLAFLYLSPTVVVDAQQPRRI